MGTWLVVSMAGVLERRRGRETKDDGQSGVKWWIKVVGRIRETGQSPGCGTAREERK